MDLAVWLLIPGFFLILWGISAKQPPSSSALPPARIEDGRPIQSSGHDRPAQGGTGRIVLGTLLMVGGVLLWIVVEDLRSSSSLLKLGRPLRVHGRPRRCRLARGTGWHDDATPSLAGLGAWRRARLGARWLLAARAEHASVPAFHHLGRQLAAAGAPAALVDRCEIATGDEVRHARRCFALARAYAGIDWTAGELRDPGPAAADLPSLAVESLVDGCLGEGIAADLAREGARRATDPVIAGSLEMIAHDEASHAELAWDVVAFCIARGGAEVQRALATAAHRMRAAASPGPIDLDRPACRQIAGARLSSVRDRLATLMPYRTMTPTRST